MARLVCGVLQVLIQEWHLGIAQHVHSLARPRHRLTPPKAPVLQAAHVILDFRKWVRIRSFAKDWFARQGLQGLQAFVVCAHQARTRIL